MTYKISRCRCRRIPRVVTFERYSTDGGGELQKAPMFMYYVNDGVYGSFNCLLYDHAEVEPTLLHPDVSRCIPLTGISSYR